MAQEQEANWKSLLIAFFVSAAVLAGFLLGPTMIVNSYVNLRTVKKFKETGTLTTATINEMFTERIGRNTNNYADVSYWDGDVIEGGQLYSKEIRISTPVYNKYYPGDKVQILYYFDDKGRQHVMLKASTEYKYFGRTEKMPMAILVTLIGMLVTVVCTRYFRRKRAKQKQLEGQE